jgi:hypothetical protein
MKKFLSLFFIAIFAIGINAQTSAGNTTTSAGTTPAIDSSLMDLAKATLLAHGGEKFKSAKTIIMRGSVEVSAPNSAQTLPAAFNIVFAGEKYRFDILAPPILNFQQVSDGQQTFSSMAGISLPPMNRLGLPLLTKLDDTGFVVSGLPEKLKKKKGFRITSPEGYYTDFIVDEKTLQVKEYESSYEVNGRTVTTSVAVSKYRDVEGVLLNERFSQRLDMGQFTSYADFKAKEILVNSEVRDDVFVMNNKQQ